MADSQGKETPRAVGHSPAAAGFFRDVGGYVRRSNLGTQGKEGHVGKGGGQGRGLRSLG